MAQWVSRILILLGIGAILSSSIMAGALLNMRHEDEFSRTDAFWALTQSDKFQSLSLEKKVIELAQQEAVADRIRESHEIWESIFFIALSIGAIFFTAGLAVWSMSETAQLKQLQNTLNRLARHH